MDNSNAEMKIIVNTYLFLRRIDGYAKDGGLGVV